MVNQIFVVDAFCSKGTVAGEGNLRSSKQLWNCLSRQESLKQDVGAKIRTSVITVSFVGRLAQPHADPY